jgi:MFS family permease
VPDGAAVAFTGYLLTVTTKGTIGVYETLGAEFALSRFAWDSVRTGYTFALCGALGVGCLLSFDRLVARFDDTDLTLAGISAMTVASVGIVGSAGVLGERGFLASLVLMYAVGYPLGHTAVLGMVSKIADAGPQGAMMGWLAAAGSLARIVFPLLAGFLSDVYDDTYIFALMALLLLMSVFFCAAMRSTIKAAG